MKEWAMKHPFMTFILLYDMMITIGNVILGKKKERTFRQEVGAGFVEGIRLVKEISDASEEQEEDRTIGFKAS